MILLFMLQAELHDVSKEMELDLLKQYLQVCTSGSCIEFFEIISTLPRIDQEVY